MKRKTFIISGLLIIHLHFIAIGTLMYLTFSRVLQKAHLGILAVVLPAALVFSFGVLLWRRFDRTGITKWALTLCLLFYVASQIIASYADLWLFQNVLENSAAQTRFFEAIGEWARSGNTEGSPWTRKHKLDYMFTLLPLAYVGYWGLYVLLWFGARNPKDSKPTLNMATT